MYVVIKLQNLFNLPEDVNHFPMPKIFPVFFFLIILFIDRPEVNTASMFLETSNSFKIQCQLQTHRSIENQMLQ